MQYDLLFERSSDEHVDLFTFQYGENAFGWIAFFIMDRRISWKAQFRKHVTKFLRRFLSCFAHVDQMKCGREAVAYPLRFSKNALKPRRKCCRHSNGLICRWILHRS